MPPKAHWLIHRRSFPKEDNSGPRPRAACIRVAFAGLRLVMNDRLHESRQKTSAEVYMFGETPTADAGLIVLVSVEESTLEHNVDPTGVYQVVGT